MDHVDITNEKVQAALDRLIDDIRRTPIKPGKPGECDLCGEWSGRLVDGVCAPCRDKYKLD